MTLYHYQPVISGDTVGLFCARHGLDRGEFLHLNPGIHNRLFLTEEGVPTAELVEGEPLRIFQESDQGIGSSSDNVDDGSGTWAILLGIAMVGVAVGGLFYYRDHDEVPSYANNPIDERALSRDPGAPLKALERLSKSPDYQIRANVAANDRTPDEILSKLATDADRDVRAALAKNPKVTIVQLTQLSTDPSMQVRLAVARNLRTPLAVLAKLGDWRVEREYLVRGAVAANVSADNPLLRSFEKDPDPDVRRAARETFSQKLRRER